jgi:uncharacterized protein (DUF1499 family)
MIPAWLSMLDGFAAILLLAGGIAAAHLEIVSALIGLQTIILGVLMGMLALLTGILGLFRTRIPAMRPGRPKALIGIVLGLATVAAVVVTVASSYGNPARYPLINDITTDFSDTPVFVHAPTLAENQDRDMGYQRAKLQSIQSAFYTSLSSLRTNDPPSITFEHVKIVASEMPDWEITYSDPKRFALEGVATTPILHSKADFVIEVRPAGSGSAIEMRSKSRDGLGDFGANAARIRSFFAMFAHDEKISSTSAAPPHAAAAP